MRRQRDNEACGCPWTKNCLPLRPRVLPAPCLVVNCAAIWAVPRLQSSRWHRRRVTASRLSLKAMRGRHHHPPASTRGMRSESDLKCDPRLDESLSIEQRSDCTHRVYASPGGTTRGALAPSVSCLSSRRLKRWQSLDPPTYRALWLHQAGIGRPPPRLQIRRAIAAHPRRPCMNCGEQWRTGARPPIGPVCYMSSPRSTHRCQPSSDASLSAQGCD